MLKSILLFIKTHSVATAITTTAVVGTVIATPTIVENYKLETSIKSNINMLIQNDNPITNTTEALTFRIEKIQHEYVDGSGTEYKIVPSYNKDMSEWTKEEKEEYVRVVEEANAMSKKEYEDTVKQEEETLKQLTMELEQQKDL